MSSQTEAIENFEIRDPLMGKKEEQFVKKDMDYRALVLLAISHMFNDVNQGSVPALLPSLVITRGLSYTAAAGVVLAATLISSLIQPFLGFYSDRHPLPWLMPVGVLIGGLGIALAGLAPSYWLIVASVLLSGAGVAAFHPEGSRFANYVSGQRATGMSYFTVGGTVGFALGPILVTPLILNFGLPGTLLMALPTTVTALWLMRELPHLVKFRPPVSESRSEASESRTPWGPFARLTAVIVLRTSVFFGLMSFIPLYYVKVRGASIAEANSALTVMLISGAVGAVIGGYIGDRIGLKSVLVGTLAAIPLLLLGFMAAPGILGLVCLGLVGVNTTASSTVSVVMGQGYLRSHIGVASGVTLGLAIGLGGVAVPLFGFIADHWNLGTALYSMTVFPVLALGVAQTLPPGYE
ncbi:MAG: MFS transporter [Desulfomonilaceae bacterium]